jgi:hypothetical protein
MFIRRDDCSYFESLYKSLDEARRKRFLEILLEAGSERSGEANIGKIQIVGDEIFNQQGIAPKEFVTRTMIKKAYRAAKEV